MVEAIRSQYNKRIVTTLFATGDASMFPVTVVSPQEATTRQPRSVSSFCPFGYITSNQWDGNTNCVGTPPLIVSEITGTCFFNYNFGSDQINAYSAQDGTYTIYSYTSTQGTCTAIPDISSPYSTTSKCTDSDYTVIWTDYLPTPPYPGAFAMLVLIIIFNLLRNIHHVSVCRYYGNSGCTGNVTLTDWQSGECVAIDCYTISSYLSNLVKCTTGATNQPTKLPTTVPTKLPTTVPSKLPTTAPTTVPAASPTLSPSSGEVFGYITTTTWSENSNCEGTPLVTQSIVTGQCFYKTDGFDQLNIYNSGYSSYTVYTYPSSEGVCTGAPESYIVSLSSICMDSSYTAGWTDYLPIPTLEGEFVS